MRRFLDPVIEELLNRVSSEWRWIRFLQYSAILGIVALGVVLLLGVGMAMGWFSSPGLVTGCFVLLVHSRKTERL